MKHATSRRLELKDTCHVGGYKHFQKVDDLQIPEKEKEKVIKFSSSHTESSGGFYVLDGDSNTCMVLDGATLVCIRWTRL